MLETATARKPFLKTKMTLWTTEKYRVDTEIWELRGKCPKAQNQSKANSLSEVYASYSMHVHSNHAKCPCFREHRKVIETWRECTYESAMLQCESQARIFQVHKQTFNEPTNLYDKECASLKPSHPRPATRNLYDPALEEALSSYPPPPPLLSGSLRRWHWPRTFPKINHTCVTPPSTNCTIV